MSLAIPEDFDCFWSETAAEANARPLDFRRSGTNDFDFPGFRVERLEFRGMERTLYGWLAYPDGARRLRGFLWLPPYGRESMLPDRYGTRAGYASMSFNFFGHDAFHEEAYLKERGYFTEGVESPRTWVFRRMAQDAMIALRVLRAQAEVDENRIGSMGMSQGAGMSIWIAGWSNVTKAVCADMPFLGGFREVLSKPVHRYPTKELTDYAPEGSMAREQIYNTLSYFDTVNLASRCKVPARVSLGLKDPAAKPGSVRAIYEALPGEKLLREYDWGHDWHPSMVDENRDWLDAHL